MSAKHRDPQVMLPCSAARGAAKKLSAAASICC